MSLLLTTSGDIASGVVAPEGVDFDGSFDYLSRSTDLVGNVDSKTFTFSAWVYIQSTNGNEYIYYTSDGISGYIGFAVQLTMSNGSGTIIGYNATTPNLYVSLPAGTFTKNTFTNILISMNLDNTSNRFIYVNDKSISASFSTYSKSTIDFTVTNFCLGGQHSSNIKGRLAHVFLDYTYRDLSIEANRRLFITADGKPTPTGTLKALNPILYLPMKDNATAHINDGTGGNFTLNGTIATSERGANQDNCVAMKFNANNVSLTSSFIPSSTKTFTIRVNANFRDDAGDYTFYSNGAYFYCRYDSGANAIKISARGTVATYVLEATIPLTSAFTYMQNLDITVSVDLSSTLKRQVYINNRNVSYLVTWITYINEVINFSTTGAKIGGDYYFNCTYGELYFDTKYIDLATNNPFWDKDTNKPIPVRKVISNTGVTPLIAMPLDASNAGKNYGTGGDFTANSSPYVGARGASEFWQRTAKFDGTTSYLSSTGLVGISDSKYLTIVANVYKTASSVYFIISSGTGLSIQMQINSSNQLIIGGRNVNDVDIFNFTSTTTIPNLSWTTILVSIDLTNSSNRWIYFNNTYVTGTWSIYTNDFIKFSNLNFTIGTHSGTFTNSYNGSMSLWLDNTYTNFGQESNRLKYIDGLGYPTDLNKKVSDGIITKPALYLDFNDTSNFGKNMGYGGDFVVNGTITAGADVLG